MKKYELSENDIDVLIGAAANKVCEDGNFPLHFDLFIMAVAAEISDNINSHLSGEKTFPEYVLCMLRQQLKTENERPHMPGKA